MNPTPRHLLLAACQAGVVAGAAAQTAASGPEWVYRAVPGDNLTVVARNCLQPPYAWEHLQQRNRLNNPNYLLPGSALTIPVAWLRRDASVAEVLYVQGDANVRADSSSAPLPAAVGDKLKPGAALSTGTQSSLVLRLADGSRLMLTPQTQVTLERLLTYGRSGLSQAGLQIQRGGVEAQVPARPAPVPPLEIRTPTATLGVRGTQFRAAADAQTQASRVEVITGAVAAVQGSRDVRVEAGFGAVAGATVSDPRPLLPAPGLASASTQVTQWPAVQVWQPVPGAAAYRAQLFGDEQASRLLGDQTAAEPTARYETLADGRYWLRVRAVAPDGLEGRDALWRFDMVLAPAPGPPAPAPAAPADGDTLTGSSATLAWTAGAEGSRYRLQVAATPDFAAPAIDLVVIEPGPYNLVQIALPLLPGRWYWRAASVSPTGTTGPFGGSRSFTLRPAVR